MRERCRRVLALAQAGATTHFRYLPAKLDGAARRVAVVTRQRYPDLAVPLHSRWRHFEAGGVDRWRQLASTCGADAHELARIGFDLVIASVLLDAGAGPRWRYREAQTGRELVRSEGLAVATFEAFRRGAFSGRPDRPLRADADGLEAVEEADLAAHLQCAADNPVEGLPGRVSLLRRLGALMRGLPELFGDDSPRLGNLFDHLHGRAIDGALPVATVLEVLLRALGPIWPGRLALGGVPLGDVWRHRAVTTGDATTGLVPFHKLSQWLAYSLVEPLAASGLRITGIETLTGLAEYRNGGLLVDAGVLAPVDPRVLDEPLPVDDEAVVEWRALTVALLDVLADRVRALLGVRRADLPLAAVLEGGTWAAGRAIAAERRPGGEPPIRIVSDGTVF